MSCSPMGGLQHADVLDDDKQNHQRYNSVVTRTRPASSSSQHPGYNTQQPAAASVCDTTTGNLKGKVKVKVWVLVIVLLMRLEQQRFTISEVAADWHELMIPWHICGHPLPTMANNWTRGAARQIYHRPNQPH